MTKASISAWVSCSRVHGCSPYSKKRDYSLPQSVEREIVRRLGAVYGPYTGRCFGSVGETDIEHIVATSETHDAGLCARPGDDETLRQGSAQSHPGFA